MSSREQAKLESLLDAMRKQSGGELPKDFTLEQGVELLEKLLRGAGEAPPLNLGFEQGLKLLKMVLPPAEDPNSPRARKKQRIIEAAAELFAKSGFRKTSIDEVARRAHVAKGTVYLYFESKSALLLQAIAREKTRYAAKVATLFEAELSPRDMLRAWLRAFFQGIEEMPIVARLMSGDREVIIALEEIDDKLSTNVVGVQTDVVAQMVHQAMAPHRLTEEEIHDRAQLLMALLYTGAQIFDDRLRGGISRERFAALLADMIVDGLAGPRAEDEE